ncbi:MAG: hypothetical protein M0R03_08145 [Novosphingobium sp.]|nr:hypothetical protein [Novosphingobium sp.]
MNIDTLNVLKNKCIKSILESVEKNRDKLTDEEYKKIRKVVFDEVNDLMRIIYEEFIEQK